MKRIIFTLIFFALMFPFGLTHVLAEELFPVISFHSDETFEADSEGGASIFYPNPMVVDDLDESFGANCLPASGDFFPLGTTTVYCLATDSEGNSASSTSFNIIVVDTKAPTLILNGDSSIDITGGDTYTELGATAADIVDGEITARISITGSVDTLKAGSYTLIYDVSDLSGNSSQTTRIVNVSDAFAPVIELIGDNPQIITRKQAYVELGATATDDVDGEISMDEIEKKRFS
ncbi:MAG: DUF5011 domain-containing protein [Candidatus Paceibacterota bacterium]|jgi:hypothetical protein